MTYSEQPDWQKIQSFLPIEMQLSPGHMPQEEWWSWHGHQLHLDCYRNQEALAKVILFHGVGTNGRQMTTILGAPLAQKGFETIAVDMPGYGVTKVAPRTLVTYDDWVQAASDLIDREMQRDARPIVLYGLSAGGMLAYHAAALNRNVKGIVGMCFLDQQVQQVRDETSLNVFMSRVGVPLAHITAHTPLAGMKMPMKLASKMHLLVNDPFALKACMRDKTSAGKWATMKFLSTYMSYVPAIAPKDFDVCPILLTQPDADRWTPRHLSDLFLDRITRVPVDVAILPGAGHYPIESIGLSVMQDAVAAFVSKVCDLSCTGRP